MNSEHYKIEAERTLSPEWHITNQKELNYLHGAMGIITELGEIIEAIEARRIDVVNLSEEIGDILWYLTIFERGLSINLEVDTSFIANAGYENLKEIVLDSTKHASELLDVFKKRGFYGKNYEFKSRSI